MTLPFFDDLKDIARQDYSFYLEYVHRGNFHLAKHIKLITDHLEAIDRGELNKLMIFCPPRHGKSSTVTENFPSWYLGRDPSRKVIIACYGDQLAKKFGRSNRQRVEEFGPDLFGINVSRDNSSVQLWGIEGHGGHCLSMGFGSSITGFGASLLLIDDPIKGFQQSESLVQRDHIWNEYQATLLTRLERKKGSAQIIIQTRWHEDDLSGRVLNSDGGKDWSIISLPALAEDNDILGRKENEPLWPEQGFNEIWAEETKRAVGSRTWAALYQQRPSDLEGSLFKRAWLKYYKTLPELDEQIISVDTTFKDVSTADFCVMQVWGRKGADRYLIDQVRDRMDLPQTIQALRSLALKYPRASRKLIEDKANGSAVISMLKHEISGLIPVNPTESKIARAYSVTPEFEAGNVFLPADAPWLQDYVHELTSFPTSKNDDQVDSTVQALSELSKANEIFIGRA